MNGINSLPPSVSITMMERRGGCGAARKISPHLRRDGADDLCGAVRIGENPPERQSDGYEGGRCFPEFSAGDVRRGRGHRRGGDAHRKVDPGGFRSWAIRTKLRGRAGNGFLQPRYSRVRISHEEAESQPGAVDIKKEGSSFNLRLAVGILVSSGQVRARFSTGWCRLVNWQWTGPPSDAWRSL
jgi:hypothetical protein